MTCSDLVMHGSDVLYELVIVHSDAERLQKFECSPWIHESCPLLRRGERYGSAFAQLDYTAPLLQSPHIHRCLVQKKCVLDRRMGSG